ncbi:CHASE domain-containing protein [Azohydromonas aeria]|uniref:CHASE domain-containing protein n=1 Tax=Azohydromonas aeria TaxID=2590212 RepID=UPI0018E05BA8|nr:CHASE domain-containing protein [Azohydromonas aeria]
MAAIASRRPPSTASLVLMLGLGLSAGAAWYVHDAARTRVQQEFESRARIVGDLVGRRIEGWVEVLHGVQGLFAASDTVTRDEFARHARQLALPQRHPGFLALQFVRWVPGPEKEAFEAMVRADTSVRPQGYPDFTVHPPGERLDYHVIDYIEPMAGNESSFGLDVATMPQRRLALERARDSGRITTTSWPRLQRTQRAQPGFVLRAPVYRPLAPLETVSQRREAFLGAVTVVMSVGQFLEATVGAELLQQLDLRLYDLGWEEVAAAAPVPGQLLHDSVPGRASEAAAEPGLVYSLRLPVGDRVWLLQLHRAGSGVPDLAAWLVLLGGALASVLLWRLLGLQQRVREELAERVAARTAELAEANAALKASEQRLELALDGADLGLWDWDVASGTLAWNTRWLAMRGCAASDLLPSVATWKGLIHPQDRAAMQAALDAHLEGRSPAYVAEYRVGSGTGPWRWVLDAGRVVERDAQGRPLRMAGTNLDISERKHAEEDRAAREAAERASRAKSEFLARTSHELRTPLNAILGFAQMMRLDAREPLAAPQRQRLQRIQDAGEHLLAMINEMLDLTGIESGSLRLALGPVALAPLAQACLQALEPQARAAGVRMEVALGAEAGAAVQADATRLREVLLNLLSNAVKYNRRDGWVRLTARDAGPGRLAIAVEDCGVGLSDAQLAQLFQPFNRLGAERSGIEGSGLGLVIAQRLAQLMQGSLRARRREQGGSVFVLELPRAADADAPASGSAALESAAGPAPGGTPPAPAARAGAGAQAAQSTQGSGEGLRTWQVPGWSPVAAAAPPPAADVAAAPRPRDAAALVLYIEDEPVNALLMQHVLGLRPQCTLRLAEDGATGLVLARRERPALVLIDLNLPDMSGYEVLARLRADPATRGLRCVALTADAMPENVERARAAGFDAFWSKPIEVQSFLGGLDEQLGLARETPAAVP